MFYPELLLVHAAGVRHPRAIYFFDLHHNQKKEKAQKSNGTTIGPVIQQG